MKVIIVGGVAGGAVIHRGNCSKSLHEWDWMYPKDISTPVHSQRLPS